MKKRYILAIALAACLRAQVRAQDTSKISFELQQTFNKQWGSIRDVVDLDNDGDLDVLAESQAKSLFWYKNDGTGIFEEQLIIAATGRISDVYITDLDKDKDLDVLYITELPNYDAQLAWLENDGTGSFEENIIDTQTVYISNVVSAVDLDGDGDQDILSAADNYSTLFFYERNEQGGFEERIAIATPTGTRDIRTADLDSDGDQDVLIDSFYYDGFTVKINWYENNGTGDLNEPQTLFQIKKDFYSSFVSLFTDFDEDGDLDLLTSSNVFTDLISRSYDSFDLFFEGKVAWYENNGEGSFAEQPAISVNRFIGPEIGLNSPIAVADLDNDGDQDVLTNYYTDFYTSSDSGGLVWYENDGKETFGERQQISELEASGFSLFTADLDQDGDEDILTSTKLGKVWYKNQLNAPISGVEYFTLVNNNTDSDIRQLQNGDVISLDELGSKTFTVRANVLPNEQRIRRVEFRLAAPVAGQGALRSEYAEPYALFTDNKGDYFGQKAYAGEYKLRATPYYLDNAGKEVAGVSKTVRFTFTDTADDSGSRLATNVGMAYPVPFNETLNLKLGVIDMNQARIQLVHGYGKVYEVQPSQVSQTDEGLMLNLANLPSGPYTVRVMNAGQVQTFRVSKE